VMVVVRFLVESLDPLPSFQDFNNNNNNTSTLPKIQSPRDEIKLQIIQEEILRKVNGFSEQRLRELVYELLPRARPGLLLKDLIYSVEIQVPFTQWGTILQRPPNNLSSLPPPVFIPNSVPPPAPKPPPLPIASQIKPLQIKKKTTTTTEDKPTVKPTSNNNVNFMQELQSAVKNNKLTPSTERKENERNPSEKLNDRNPPSFVDELKNVMHTGTLRLKKINTEEEMEKRRREKQESKALDLLREISEVGQQRTKATGMNYQVTLRRRGKTFVTEKRATDRSPLAPKTKKTLIDTTALLGMQIYQRDIGQWVLDVQTILASRKQMLFLVFHLLEMRDFEMPFLEALVMITTANDPTQSPHLHEELAESLVRIGFTIRRKKWVVTTFLLDENGNDVEDEKEENEYTLIIRPLSFPVKYLLKTIVLILPS